MEYKCEINELPEQLVLAVRTRSSVFKLPKVLAITFEKFDKRFKELGEEPVGAPFVAYYNMNMFNLDIEIGFPVTKVLQDDQEIKAGIIPAGKFAMTEHQGPYNKIRPAYDALKRFVKSEGYQATGVAYEYYLNDPAITKPNDLLTRVVFPLKPDQ